jgi:pimeloyl-ACP methyl ester carboxylesterase
MKDAYRLYVNCRSEKMPQTLDLTAGTIAYEDTGGSGPVVLFVHGLLVGGTLWRKVVAQLDGFRCVVPTLPLGSHPEPMRDRTALTPVGVADLLAEFMERLELTDVTIVANDTGGAITQLLLTRRPERVARVVFTPCDAFENFLPPAFRPLQWAAKARLLAPALLLMHVRALRPTPLAYGVLTKRRVPDEVLESWVRPALSSRAVRGDVQYFTRHIDKRLTLDAAAKLGRFDKPVLFAWSAEDRFFKIAFAQRLAAVFPDARVEPIADARTFLPEDQPEVLAGLIAGFARASGDNRPRDAAGSGRREHPDALRNL